MLSSNLNILNHGGISMTKNNRPLMRPDKQLSTAVWLLIIFGCFMIASTAVGSTTTQSNIVISTILKQLIFVAGAAILMKLLQEYGSLQLFSHVAKPLCVLWLLAMLACFAFPGVYGSHAWIQLGPVSLQPSEFGKPLLIMLCADAVRKAKTDPERREKFTTCFKFPLAFIAADIALLIMQKDYGTLVITVCIGLACMLMPGWKSLRRVQRRLILGFSTLVIAGIVLIYSGILSSVLAQFPATSHVAIRIENMIDPYTDIYGEGYQPANALYSIGSANFFGKGFGNSARKYGYLTQADNDYILAVTIEETGIAGLAILVGFYILVEYRLFWYAFKTRSTPYKVLLSGTAIYLFLHLALNIGGVSGLIPMTGIPLLFISSGGSSLWAAATAIGVSQNAICHIRAKEIKRKRVRHESRVLRNV